MTVLILGSNGFIGTATAHALAARGVDVVGAARSREPSQALPGAYLQADRDDADSVLDALRRANADILIDVIAMTEQRTSRLLDRIGDVLAHYVMLSSADVYRNYELLHRKATGPCATVPLAEDSALRESRYPYRSGEVRTPDDAWLEDYDKIPVEEVVRRLPCPWTILRLPMVYGPGDRQRRFRWAIEPMTGAARTLELPMSWAAWRTTYGHVENVAAAIGLAAGNPAAYGATFNVGEAAPVDQRSWAQRIKALLDWPGEIQIVDDEASAFGRRLRGMDLGVPLLLDSTRIRRELGYVDPVPLSRCLETTVADERRLEED